MAGSATVVAVVELATSAALQAEGMDVWGIGMELGGNH